VGPAPLPGHTFANVVTNQPAGYLFDGATSENAYFSSVGGLIEDAVQTVPAPYSQHLASWYMVDYSPTDYIQAGFMTGVNCGGTTSPEVWLEYSVHEATPPFTDVCFSQYVISPGQSYDFSVTSLGAYNWGAYIYWNGAWNLLGAYQLAFSTSQVTNVEEYVEFYNSPDYGYTWPQLNESQSFSSSLQLSGQPWQLWTILSTTDDSASSIGQYTAFYSDYNNWEVYQ
jgi:hypothetical protein